MFFKRGKVAQAEWEIPKIIIAVIILVVLGIGAILIFKGKGGDGLTYIKNLFHFGRA